MSVGKPVLKGVTLLIVDCVDFDRAKLSLDHCSACATFDAVKFLTHFDASLDPRIVNIPKTGSIEEYSEFMVKQLTNYFDTPHVLVVQWDGFISTPESWSDEFLEYDYIGAPWWPDMVGPGYPKDYCVGNGGFSLRSKRLQDYLATDAVTMTHRAEDVVICQHHREAIEQRGMTFAPLDVARRFSHECYASDVNAFGVHALTKLVTGKPKKRPITVYDCFLYNGELKMLNFRLHELDEYVDYFVIGESEYTFKGDKRPLSLPLQLHKIDARFRDKIVYVKHSQTPHVNPWDNEKEQRNNIALGLQYFHLEDKDIIMLSDVDEIPDTKFLSKIRGEGFTGIGACYQNFHYYSFACLL